MVTQNSSSGSEEIRFLLLPNRSMSWRGNLIFIGGIFFISATIAVAFAMVGLWMILPFAGLEVGALAFGLYLTSLDRHCAEEVTIGEDKVLVKKGQMRGWDAAQPELEFQRFWVRVSLKKSGHDWYPSRLLLNSHGKTVEIGRFLDEDERKEFASKLADLLGWRDAGSKPIPG